MQPEDGGPAFPSQLDTFNVGMSLRDWFAGQALIGLLHPDHMDCIKLFTNDAVKEVSENMAVAAYAIADAMLNQ